MKAQLKRTSELSDIPDRNTTAVLDDRRPEQRAWVVPAAGGLIVLLACLTTLALGLPYMMIYGHDIFNLLDGPWRVLQGQIPHVDFYSAFGPIFYLIWAAGLWLAHYRVDGLVYATALAGVVLGLWALAVFRVRLSALGALVATSFVICFWLAPFPIGEPYYLQSYSMQYNRLGYVILAIVLGELLGHSSERNNGILDYGGLSTGLALGLLLFMKANFFIVGLALASCIYLIRIKAVRHALAAAAGILIVTAAITCYLHGHLGAFWEDMRIAAGARSGRLNLLRDLPRVALRNVTTMVTLAGVALLTRYGRGRAGSLYPWGRAVILIAAVVASDCVLSLSNQQRFGFPLSVVATLIFADQMSRPGAGERLRGLHAAATLLLIITALPFIVETANAWAVQVTMRHTVAETARVNAPHMASLRFVDHVDPVWDQRSANGLLVTSRVNEGIALLTRYSRPGERVTCLCYANPFSYALLRQPIHGGSPFFDYGFNMTERFAPSADRILGNADLVIYRKAEVTWPTVATLLKLCKPLLSNRYQPLAESKEWILLKKT